MQLLNILSLICLLLLCTPFLYSALSNSNASSPITKKKKKPESTVQDGQQHLLSCHVVKQRMQTGQFASAPNAVRLIVAKEGFRGLYAGYSSFLLRDLPFDAIQFCIYEQLRIGYKIADRFGLLLK